MFLFHVKLEENIELKLTQRYMLRGVLHTRGNLFFLSCSFFYILFYFLFYRIIIYDNPLLNSWINRRGWSESNSRVIASHYIHYQWKLHSTELNYKFENKCFSFLILDATRGGIFWQKCMVQRGTKFRIFHF